MAKNSVFVVAQFGVYTISGIIFIPFLKEHYGWDSYGLIALAGFLTQYVGLVTRCVGNAIARFLNIALNQNDWKQANEIFSTALVANAALILMQIPFFALGIWKLDWLIDFSEEIGTDFRILVACNVLVFFISMITGVVGTPIQASNRLDLGSTRDMGRLTVRLVLLYTLIKTVGAKLWIIGVVDLGLAVVDLLVIYLIYRKLAKDLVFKLKYITRKWIRPVFNMAGWSMVSALGGCMLVKTDVWMINRFVSKEMAGVYAVLLVWPNFLKQISKQLASILTPVYMIDYAKGDSARVARISLSSAKLLGCFVAMCAGFLCVAAEPLLVLWLGPDAADHVMLFRIMVLYLAYTIGESVLWQVYVTINKVHFTGWVSLAVGMVNIAVSMSLIHLGLGAVGVAVGTVVAMTLSSSLAIPIGVCREFKVPVRLVGWNYIYATVMLLISGTATAIALYVSSHSNWIAGLVFVSLMSAGCLAAYFLVFDDMEKSLLKQMLTKVRDVRLKKV